PDAAAAMLAAKAATSPAPTRPPAMPQETHRPRPGAPLLAASTMPTIRAASRTSRKTMMAVPSIAGFHLLYDDVTARGLWVEVTEKLVTPWLQRADIDGDLLAAGHHFFPPQLGAFEFFWCWIVVLDDQRNFLAGRDLNFGWLKPMVLYDDRVG